MNRVAIRFTENQRDEYPRSFNILGTDVIDAVNHALTAYEGNTDHMRYVQAAASLSTESLEEDISSHGTVHYAMVEAVVTGRTVSFTFPDPFNND